MAENSGTEVEISARKTLPAPEHRAAPPPLPNTEPEITITPGELCGPLGCRPLYEVGTLPDVTIEDLASFRPAEPSLTGEPAGFGIVGMPTNLVATASTQDIAGTLFDWDVTVRFTPAWYLFDHGDGTSARTPTGGATWESLGVAQFTPTPTTHVYRDRGEFTVGVEVQYTAAVDFGSGAWRVVPGYVTAPGGSYDLRVVDVRTALVDRTCVEDPAGPGC